MCARDAHHQEKYEGSEHVEADGIDVGHPPAADVLLCEKPRVKEQEFEGSEKFGIVMRNILEKVAHQVAERLLCFHVFLSAIAAKAAGYFVPAVKAGIVFPEMLCFQDGLIGLGQLNIKIYELFSCIYVLNCPER
jgi:hypothetical protein